MSDVSEMPTEDQLSWMESGGGQSETKGGGQGEGTGVEANNEDAPGQGFNMAPGSQVTDQTHSAEPVDLRQSQVVTATSLDLPNKSKSDRTHPLTLDWAFGINHSLPVFSLQDHERCVILYACSHVAVIYDHTSNTQHILQGHCNPVSCMCVSVDRRWLVTADSGGESLVIIWDTYTGIPVRTLFDCHPEGGVAALALSHDTKYLVTVGAGAVQRVCIWDWTRETDSPLWVTELSPKLRVQTHVLFNPADCMQLLSNSEKRVVFYRWGEGSLRSSAPAISDKTFKRVVGLFSQSVFNSGGVQAYSATSLGNVLLWVQERGHSTYKALRLIPLQAEGITVLTVIERFIVTGDARGQIKFYDENLKLINSYSEFGLDPIASVSFSKECPPSGSKGYAVDCTLKAEPFVMRNFIFSTVTARVAHVTPQGNVAQDLLMEHADWLGAVACHPQQPLVTTGSHSGALKVWDYERHQQVCSRVFQKHPKVQCLAYDPRGFYLAVGFASGEVCLLDACTLQSETEDCFSHTTHAITHISFSRDSLYLATADAGKAVMLFQLRSTEGRQRWQLQGRFQSHYHPIQDLLFGEQLDSKLPCLFSLGLDRRLVEYDLQNSTEGKLVIMQEMRVDQSAVPSCMAWYPPLTPEHFLVIASHPDRMKLFDCTTMMCRKTVLSPTRGSPMKKMVVLPQTQDSKSRHMAYITRNMVGMQILPLDGNPYNSNMVLCHSTGVAGLACSHDGRLAFTAGGPDSTVFCWEMSATALEAAAALGGKDLTPFYSLLEGGRYGAQYREVEDFFYYCQLRSQGLDVTEPTRVSTHISLSEVPFILRAMGVYPTQQEMEDILNELKFGHHAETGRCATELDLPELIRLLVNRRSMQGLQHQDLLQVFKVLGKPDASGRVVICRDELLELLQTTGEHMTQDELALCLGTLLSPDPEEGSEGRHWEDVLPVPREITMETLLADILGLSEATGGIQASSDADGSVLKKN
ncbi:cilia- and flagella-associated protein 251 [Denticeps clupeoides]|uniref:cilia- and flagella-associated protein 251 n=1 Tax=Denticeps clupeoides TaxID=299321 RepID=UPI0010A3D39E|nr:cilia- and flagella-associated protein 251 [Denticeps clupeoides]